MTRDERLSIFQHALQDLMQRDNAMVIFNLAHDEDSFAQFSHARASEPVFCEVSNRSEAWNESSLDVNQIAALRSLGYQVPSPHHQANPHKEFSGDVNTLAEEVEQIFTRVFLAAPSYDIISSEGELP
ncbi:MAG: hypothetical protein HZB51_17560 [Chloroflexi bacterium]|nr:hypothetical protein [Chloroflexota bacterium]